MPDPAGHAAHDPLLVAAHAAGDASGGDLARAAALVASCPDCARLHRDLRAVAAALAAAPAPARPRDFRLTAERAAALRRPAGWRRLLAPIAGARSAAGPLAASLAALGVAGLLLSGGLGLRLTLGGAASAPAASMAAAADMRTSGAGAPSAGSSAGPSGRGPDDGLPTGPLDASAGPSAAPSPASSASSGAPDILILRRRAIAIARASQPRFGGERVLEARLGTFADLVDPYARINPPVPDPTSTVWRITLGWQSDPLTGQGVDVVVDGTSGRVIQAVEWIS